jgi:MerR family transcriptional regulator/heat shock protein HspR
MEPVMDIDARALYVISVAAELAGVHPQTLRIYERKGLLAPARTTGRSRRYSDRDIALLRRIQELTSDGVSLAGVQRILALEDDLVAARARIAELEAMLDALQREAERRVEAAHRQYRRELVPVRSAVVARFAARSSPGSRRAGNEHDEREQDEEGRPWP